MQGRVTARQTPSANPDTWSPLSVWYLFCECRWTVSLEALAHLLVAYGYVVMFVAITLDCVALPIPGELFLLTFGGVAVQAHLDLGGGILVAALAVLVGESISYWAGRLGGKRVLTQLRFVQRWKLGSATIVFGRFVVGARVVVAPLAGARRLPFGRFLLCDAFGALLWAGLFVLLGHGARVNLAAVQGHWTSVTTAIEIVLAVAAAAWLAIKVVRLPRLPPAVGAVLIAIATLRPATASASPDLRHDLPSLSGGTFAFAGSSSLPRATAAFL